uniref:G protein-coupled receptor n=1 Tax=Pristionchus pacificus TaxID=54126 RepID=A0A2A6BWP2_PRIPA
LARKYTSIIRSISLFSLVNEEVCHFLLYSCNCVFTIISRPSVHYLRLLASHGLQSATMGIMASLEGTFGSTMFMCTYYLSIGTIAIVANALNIGIYGQNKDMRKRYLYFIAFEVGELLNSISFLLTGAGRMTTLLNGTMTMPITAHECFFRRWWPHTLILGTEVPTLILCLISLERICAVARPALYNRLFNGRSKKVMLALTCVISLVSLIIGGVSAYNNLTVVKSGHCPIISSTAICSFATNHSDYGGTTRRRTFSSRTSIVMVAAPSVVMIGIRWSVFIVDDTFVAISYSFTALVSIVNTLINFLFREEFRYSAMRALDKIGLMLFRSFAVLCMLALALEAKMQNITVKGTTICHKRRVAGVLVQLWERDTFDPNDLLKEVRSDSNGDFTNCERIAEYDVPKAKIGSTYDMTYIPMNIAVAGEKSKCKKN